MRLIWILLPSGLVAFLLWANWSAEEDRFPDKPHFLVTCYGQELFGSFTAEDGQKTELEGELDFPDILLAKGPETGELLVYKQDQDDFGRVPAPTPLLFVIAEDDEARTKFVAYPPFEGELTYSKSSNQVYASYYHRKDGVGWTVEGACSLN